MDRFASCAKSAVSIQEQTCHKQACAQLRRRWQQVFQVSNGEQNSLGNHEQLISEISRLKRKLSITQKSKHLLSDELNLVKEELQIAKNKLKNLKETKNARQQLSVSQITVFEDQKTNRIVIKQRAQQIEMLVTALKQKNRQIQSLRTKNIHLNEEINSKNSMLLKMQESTNCQLNFYRRQINHLQESLQSKNKEIDNRQKFYIKALQKEKEECSKIKKSMQIKLIQKEDELEELLEKEKKLFQAINDLQQKIRLQEEQLNNHKQQNSWLKKLIEEAKIEYIHNQLVKLEQKDKTNKQMQDKKKRTKIAQLSKHLKSQAMMSTGLPSAKTHRISNNSSTTCIAPFRLTPQDLNLSEFQLPLDRSELNQC